MTHELLNKVRDAKTIAEVKQAIDSLYSIFTHQLDDEGIVELVDADRYCELTDQIINLRRACDHAKSFLTEANAPVAIPMAKAMVVACLSTFAFTGALSPAALEAVRRRQRSIDGAATARAAIERTKNKPIIDAAVANARKRWLDSKKARPPSHKRFAELIVEDVNNEIHLAGSNIFVKESAIAKRLQQLNQQEQRQREQEELFG